MSEARRGRDAASELADVTRRIARLLSQSRYDEAELAALDVRATTLREQVRQHEEEPRLASERWDGHHYSGSGG